MRIGVEWACSDLSISTASACGLKASVLAIEWNTVYAKLDCAPFVHSTASIAQSFRHKPPESCCELQRILPRTFEPGWVHTVGGLHSLSIRLPLKASINQ